MRAIFTMLISVATCVFVAACVLMPESFQAGINTNDQFQTSGYSASFRWSLKPRRVVQENFVSTDGGSDQYDLP